MIRIALPIIMTIMATPALAAPWPICDRGQPDEACVVDGDTIHWHGLKIRLTQTDAPETEHARCPAELAAGIRARDRLADLLGLGAEVRLSGRQDRYRRELGTVETPLGDAESVMLGEGLTLVYRSGRDAKAERMRHWCGG